MARRREKRECRAVVLEPKAAGIDIGAEEIYVAVPPDRDENSVRRFSSFTGDLHALADWLLRCGIRTVAMESTGVYWIPLFQILEARGLEVYLVNAHYLKSVPGRKSDVSDCQWIQYLHSVGLLKASFRPPSDICAVRSLWPEVAQPDESAQTRRRAATRLRKQAALLGFQIIPRTTGSWISSSGADLSRLGALPRNQVG